jgi:hypothetical protein
VAPGWQTSFGRCCISAAQACPETTEIFPESPDFPEASKKSPEYLDLVDKIVLSGDCSRLAYSPPPLGDIKILSSANTKVFSIVGDHEGFTFVKVDVETWHSFIYA